MKTVFAALSIALALLLFAPSGTVRADEDIMPSTRDAIKQLQDAGDVTGIIDVWEGGIGKPEETGVGFACTRAILSCPREKFIPALEEGMKSRDPMIADWCMRRLLDFHNQQGIEALYRKISIASLTLDQEKRAKELVGSLTNDDFSTREAAVTALIEMGSGVIRILQPLTKDADPQLAASAKDIVAKVCPQVTYFDAQSLRMIGDQCAMDALRSFIKNEEYGSVAAGHAIEQLTYRATPDDAALICKYLHDDNSLRALRTRAQLKDPTAVQPLIDILAQGHAKCDPPTASRGLCYVEEAAKALGLIGDKRAVEPVEKALTAEVKGNGAEGDHHKKHAQESIIAALARCGEKKNLYDLIERADPGALPIYLCGPDDVDFVCSQIPRVKDLDTLGGIASWLNNYVKGPDEKLVKTIRDVRSSLMPTKPSDAYTDRITLFLIWHGDTKEKEGLVEQTKSEDPKIRYDALKCLGIIRDESLIPAFVVACEDKGVFAPVAGHQIEVRSAAVEALERICGEPFYLWDFDRDRQVAEIKAWYTKYQEQKAAEQKPAEQKPGEN